MHCSIPSDMDPTGNMAKRYTEACSAILALCERDDNDLEQMLLELSKPLWDLCDIFSQISDVSLSQRFIASGV